MFLEHFTYFLLVLPSQGNLTKNVILRFFFQKLCTKRDVFVTGFLIFTFKQVFRLSGKGYILPLLFISFVNELSIIIECELCGELFGKRYYCFMKFCSSVRTEQNKKKINSKIVTLN